jgi:arylsulfatase A-like enzyme
MVTIRPSMAQIKSASIRSIRPLVAFIIVAIFAGCVGPVHREEAGPRRPNIVVILADDLGYGGLSCQGGDLKTPHIDALAQSGIRFTNGYVSCPVCSPTRAGLMTGRYQQRFGHEFNPGPPRKASVAFGLPVTEVTIADRLKAAGYTTGVFGKWHLGHAPERLPSNRGFGEFFGFPGGGHRYLKAEIGSQNPIMRGDQPVDEKEYLTDAFTREAVAFIDRHAKDSKPFFLYLPYNAVHTPMEATEEYLERFPQIEDPLRRKHAAMLAAMDDGIGAVMTSLRKHDLEDRTLVIFFSDNGGPTKSNTSSNKPLRGFKGQVLEGGIRIPFIVAWKGHLPAGMVDDRPIIQLDIMPTALAVAGGSLPTDRQIDGVNLMPYLTGKLRQAPHEILFWRMGPQAAVRKGDWKLIRREDSASASQPAGKRKKNAAARARRQRTRNANAKRSAGVAGIGPIGSAHLYNLATDIHEDNDLAEANPDKVKELSAALDAWESQLVKPLWRGKGKFRNRRATQPADGKVGKGQGKRGQRKK